VVHIVHRTSDASAGDSSNITNAQVQNALDRLNQAFRNAGNYPLPGINTGIQFCLARIDYNGDTFSGIVRHSSNSLSNWRDNQKGPLMALGQYFTADKYINIYVVNQILDSSGTSQGKRGLATYPYYAVPGVEGLVIAHDFFGDYRDIGAPLNKNSLGFTLPHEMGHYFGIYHPFDFPCQGVTDTTCSKQGDMCCDVPAVNGRNQDCSIPWNTCTEYYSGSIPDPSDQKENIMDYSHDSCKNFFTEDQASLMHFVLNHYRPGLTSTLHLNYLQMQCCFYSALFDGEDFMCSSSSGIFTALDYSTSVTYRWQFFRNDSLKNTFVRSTESLTASGLSPGLYSVKLTVTDGSDSVSWIRKNWLRVGDCSKKLKSTSSNWFFGNRAGVSFYKAGVFRDIEYYKQHYLSNNYQPMSGEGTLSISDTSGNLLFYGGNANIGAYTDSFKIYDKNSLIK
jgi:hypothetical protein